LILVDGDIIAYRCAFASKDETLDYAKSKVDEMMIYIIDECGFYTKDDIFKVYLTGKGNFRNEVAKTAVYKGHRKDKEKPRHLNDIRDYLMTHYRATMSEDEEADDLISKEATRLNGHVVIASADKDMLQIPALHFNFNKNEFKNVDDFEGIKFFYTQMLTGDDADNIKGLWRVGPKKAEKILEGCETEQELYERTLKAYDGDIDRIIENGRLLWLRRHDGELWEPPTDQSLKRP
jgi:5'-3' exonuclease